MTLKRAKRIRKAIDTLEADDVSWEKQEAILDEEIGGVNGGDMAEAFFMTLTPEEKVLIETQKPDSTGGVVM